MLPKIIGFGAHKSGTSWLFENLIKNPGVWRSPFKEMHYFSQWENKSQWWFSYQQAELGSMMDKALIKANRKNIEYINKLSQHTQLSENWYRDVYSLCPQDKVAIDVTPAYALINDNTITYMHDFLGVDFKGIFLIRHPVERAISHIKGAALASPEQAGSFDFWMEKFEGKNVSERNNYEGTINRLDRHLKDRVIYQPFGRIEADPIGLLREIEEHCGLMHGDYETAGIPRHKTKEITVPAGIREAFTDKLQKQVDFLKARFSESFTSQI